MFLKTNMEKHIYCYSGIPGSQRLCAPYCSYWELWLGCGFVDNSPHVHFLILLAALLKTWKHSSDQNAVQMQTEVLICLPEATETYNQKATWAAFWGTALEKTLLFESQNLSDDTNHQKIWLLKGSQTHWLRDQFTTRHCMCSIRQLWGMLLWFLVSWPPTLPNLCLFNFTETDIFCGNQIWIKILSFILL